ncbi:hypothetical protein [Bifidobacterium leontopitheci]|uniref:Uncharacterized protein n=1 Tax=Bifidobacterium leontopitheci TaxID=2650774 RepID=A0A6I1GGN8_9BIFI|nr:hypothetical protein [Bifidobacterium leontopitheci]KAB7790824.1 hypothetical protein F7D09_0740 [Bifidobacterium leontopitheci]
MMKRTTPGRILAAIVSAALCMTMLASGSAAADETSPEEREAASATAPAAQDDDAASRTHTTVVTFMVNGHAVSVTRTYTRSVTVTVPDDSQLNVPDGYVIVAWKSSLGVTYSADLIGATLSGQAHVTFTAVLAQRLPQLPHVGRQVRVNFVIPSTNAIVTTRVDRGTTFADAYATVRDDIASRLPSNISITGWRAGLHTYRADLSDAGTARLDTTFFAVPSIQATKTLVVFSVGALVVTQRVDAGSPLSDALAAKKGAIDLMVPHGYSITGWTDRPTGATYAPDLAGGRAEGWTMHLDATLERQDANHDDGLHVTVTFQWTDEQGRAQRSTATVIRGMWLLGSQIPSPEPPKGYRLDGWYAADGSRFNRLLPVRHDATYTARWAKVGTSGGSGDNGNGGNNDNGGGQNSSNNGSAGTGGTHQSGTGSTGSTTLQQGSGAGTVRRTALQQQVAQSMGKTPVYEQYGTMAKTGAAIATVAALAAALLLTSVAVSLIRIRNARRRPRR